MNSKTDRLFLEISENEILLTESEGAKISF